MKFLNFKDKSRILHTYREKKLWKEKIIVNEGFSEELASICKGLIQKTKYLRSQKVAKVVHDKLLVYEKETSTRRSIDLPQVKISRLWLLHN